MVSRRNRVAHCLKVNIHSFSNNIYWENLYIDILEVPYNGQFQVHTFLGVQTTYFSHTVNC